MPLVAAVESSCDVCLNIYWTESQGAAIPAVIACGHVFCRTCLETLDPPTCPLCRKAFNPDRIKKLHVDRPEPDLQTDLLRRATLAFYDTDEEHRTRLSSELDEWLQGRSDDDDFNPLRMARAAFHDLNRLNEWRTADRQTIRELSRQLIQQTHDSKHERDTSKAVEISLKTQVTELTAYIEDLETQLAPLRSELSKYQHRSNPLPAPPEPVPLDRFPAFARATAESAEGYAAYFTPARAAADPLDLRPDPKGKGKQRATPYANYNSQQTSNVIIPGASPSQRVFPASEGPSGHAYHSHAPAAAYINGYANGFGLGYSTANLGVPDDTSRTPSSTYHTPLLSVDQDGSLEEAIGGLRLYGVPAASAAIAPAVYRAPEASTSHPRQHGISDPSVAADPGIPSQAGSSRSRPSASRRRTVQVDGHLGDPPASSARLPPIYADPVPPAAVPVRPNTHAPEESQPVANAVAARRAAEERNRRNRQSGTSWGTVHTDATRDSHGSMGSIGHLVNFGPPLARRMSQTEVLLDRGLVETPAHTTETRPTHRHRHTASLSGAVETAPQDDTVSLRSTNNRHRTVPRRSPPQTVSVSDFGIVLPTQPPPMENALGLDLGAEAIPAHRIPAPTPRVQMASFLRSWS